jgi:hypothetical protein
MIAVTSANTAEENWATALSDYASAAAALTEAYGQDDSSCDLVMRLEQGCEARREYLLKSPAPHLRAAMQKVWTLCEDRFLGEDDAGHEQLYDLLMDLDRLETNPRSGELSHLKALNCGLIENPRCIRALQQERRNLGMI